MGRRRRRWRENENGHRARWTARFYSDLNVDQE
jgi:hypothetical protein